MARTTRTLSSTLAAVSLAALSMTTVATAQTQDTFTFSRQRPRLVVLLHGVTPQKDQAPEQGINSPKHARHYWGIQEIQGLTGWPSEAENRVVTPTTTGALTFEESSRWKWYVDQYTGPTTNRLAPVVFPMATFAAYNWAFTSQYDIRSYVSLMTKAQDNPSTAVMVSYRDGSKHLMPQTGDTIDQVYQTYNAVYGHLAPQDQPQIYFVGHSFGGVVARAIFAAPTGPDLFGNTLTATQRSRANFLRNRTVFLTTLSSPHTGTLISDPAGDVNAFIKAFGYSLESAVAKVDAFTANPVFAALELSTSWATSVREGIKGALAAVAGERECLQDLTRMPEYNAGVLNPNTARRQDGSFVPIYTMSGRTPGGQYMDRHRQIELVGSSQTYDIVDLLGGGQYTGPQSTYHGVRGAFEAAALFATESVLHREGYGALGKKPWGNAIYPFTDRVKSPYAGVGPLTARPVSAGINLLNGDLLGGVAADLYYAKPYTNGQDGENDNDGFLGIESGHAMGLSGPFYRVIDPSQWGTWLPWEQDNHGSMMFNPGTGAWIHNELLLQAGPTFSSTQRISQYTALTVPPKPLHDIKVELLGVHENVAGTFDWGGSPDFSVYVRVEDQTTTYFAPDDTRTWTLFKPIFRQTPSSVIPIRISVLDRDTGSNYDNGITSQVVLKDNLYVYFDTRTQKITGDVEGMAGTIISTYGNMSYKGVGLKFRITGN